MGLRLSQVFGGCVNTRRGGQLTQERGHVVLWFICDWYLRVTMNVSCELSVRVQVHGFADEFYECQRAQTLRFLWLAGGFTCSLYFLTGTCTCMQASLYNCLLHNLLGLVYPALYIYPEFACFKYLFQFF